MTLPRLKKARNSFRVPDGKCGQGAGVIFVKPKLTDLRRSWQIDKRSFKEIHTEFHLYTRGIGRVPL
jgi:hypothetical protein